MNSRVPGSDPPIESSARLEAEYWLEHKNTTILVHNHRNLVGDQIITRMSRLADKLVSRGDRNILLLVDVAGAAATRDTIATAKDCYLEIKPYLSKTAVIGITGVKKRFMNILGFMLREGIRVLDSQEEALEWLVKD